MYASTLKNLLVPTGSRIIYQGLTSPTATANAEQTLAWGTRVVGGVTPGKGGQVHLGLPVFNTVKEAVEALHPTATLVYVNSKAAAGAILEAVDAQVPIIVSVAEGVPVHDMLAVHERLQKQSKSRLIGPNTPGLINARHVRIGIMPHLATTPGCVGIVSKSGTLSYEAIGSTTRAGLGQSLVIGVGGDYLAGTNYIEAVTALLDDPHTKAIIVNGEIGGTLENDLADWLEARRSSSSSSSAANKPIYGYVAGKHALRGRVHGHAGAIFWTEQESASYKWNRLEQAGVIMLRHLAAAGETIRADLAVITLRNDIF